MKRLRAFESFVVMLVLGVVVAFCVQLSYIEGTGVGEVVRGYLPSATVVKSKGYVEREVPMWSLTKH